MNQRKMTLASANPNYILDGPAFSQTHNTFKRTRFQWVPSIYGSVASNFYFFSARTRFFFLRANTAHNQKKHKGMEPPVPGHETSHNEDYDDVTNRVRRAALDISSCILELSAKFKHYVQHQQWDCVTELSAAVRQTLRISKTFPPNDERADSDPTELVV